MLGGLQQTSRYIGIAHAPGANAQCRSQEHGCDELHLPSLLSLTADAQANATPDTTSANMVRLVANVCCEHNNVYAAMSRGMMDSDPC